MASCKRSSTEENSMELIEHHFNSLLVLKCTLNNGIKPIQKIIYIHTQIKNEVLSLIIIFKKMYHHIKRDYIYIYIQTFLYDFMERPLYIKSSHVPAFIII